MPDTPLLGLPLIAAAQAQKHVTHNEALLRLDQLIHLSVISRRLGAPPASVADGERYLVAAPAAGDWAGQQGQLALAQGGGWVFLTPRRGWRAFIESEGVLLLFDGSQWRDLLAGASVSNLARLGINASADDTNRFALAAAASLFTHAGSDHRLKLNKNTAADTASLIFQTGWSGRAEIGLAGGDDFRINVSGDGASWKTALAIERATGAVRLPATPPAVLFNQSLITQGPGFATDTALAGSAIAIAAGRLIAGSRYSLACDVSKTAAGTAAPVLTLRFGATGTLADMAIAALQFPPQTAQADDGRVSLEVTFRSAGAAAVVQVLAMLEHGLTGGLSALPQVQRRATSASFAASAAGVISVSLNAGAAAGWSVPLVQARLENLA